MTPEELQKQLNKSPTQMAVLCGVHLMVWRKWVATDDNRRTAPAIARAFFTLVGWLHKKHRKIFDEYFTHSD